MALADDRDDDWVVKFVQATQDAVVTIDAQSRIDLFNASAERMFGYSADEVLGRDVRVLMPEPYRDEHDAYIERYERTGEAHAIGRIRTVTARRRNGETFPIELSVTEISHGGVTRYGAFIRDISDKIRMQRELLEQERLAAIGTTAAKFAHEVSNPLNGMYTQAQLLERRMLRAEGTDERLLRGVGQLLRNIEHLNQLLYDFRSLSRRQDFRFTSTSLVELLSEVVQAEREVWAERRIEVTTDVPDPLPAVRADAVKLKQVIRNLCKNAVEAMPEGGTLTLRATVADGRVRLTVQDTGTGIPEDVDVFALFATTKADGTGLGLPIVRQIVAAHDGQITYDSRPGAGTAFTIDLPVSA